MKINDIYAFLQELYPVNSACDFDNVGLLIGDGETEVMNVLIALDCTKKTFEAAKNQNCQLIITHHPVIFSPLKNLLKGSIPFELVKNGIAIISMHTNLDMGDGGVNDCLCKALELSNVTSVIADNGFIIKSGVISPVSADGFADRIKKVLGGSVKYVDGGKKIEKVLVCSGSGGEFIETAIKENFDALVTAEVKHHQMLTAAYNGISLFDAGHFNTEDIVIEPLKSLLEKQFSEIHFSACHISDIKYK